MSSTKSNNNSTSSTGGGKHRTTGGRLRPDRVTHVQSKPDMETANEIFGSYARLIDELFKPNIPEIMLLAEAEQKALKALYQRLASEAESYFDEYTNKTIEALPLSKLKAIMEIKE